MSATSVTLADAVPAARATGSRLYFLDLLKAVAAQLIVLHHLAFYGPMSDHVRPSAPALIDWLADEARIAVQVFLVIAGFLAARSLASHGVAMVDNPARAIARRFLKLAPPYLVAIGLAVIASAVARMWMTHESISDDPTLEQLAAHALLLHSVLDYASLSAGAWYIAIDFQLYALLTLLLWSSRRVCRVCLVSGGQPPAWLGPVLVTAGIGVSLFYFNRDPDWDAWAPYFLGSYGLGVLASWLSDTRRRPAGVVLLSMAMLVPALAALAFDFRIRIAIALATALLLAAVFRAGWCNRPLPLAGFLGRISYSVFLVHFPVCLLVNAAFTRFAPLQAGVQAIGLLFAWLASIAAGAVFHRWIERPLGRLIRPAGTARQGAFTSGR